MAMNELLIAAFSLIHIAVHLKWKKIRYKIFYYESAIILAVGLLGWMIGMSLLAWDWKRGMFYVLTGSWDYAVQPIDLGFMGLSLLASTVLLDFLTKHYDLDRQSLLAILPWTITGQYRYLHELMWHFHYWISMNAICGNFSDWVPGLSVWTDFPGQNNWAPALATHTMTLLFILFSVFNFIVILQAFTKKRL